MNWEEYLDPYLNKQQYWGNAPAQEPTIRMPRPSDYPMETLKEPDRSLGDWLGDMIVPETREYVATGQGRPGIVGEWADSLAGKIGSLAKMGMAAAKGIPAMAGLVEMGGKRYPQAFLHRSIEPAELPYMEAHIQKQAKSYKPMTVNAPNYPVTAFQEMPFGLVFDAHKGSIKRMWPFDAYTEKVEQDVIGSIKKRQTQKGDVLSRSDVYTEDWVGPDVYSRMMLDQNNTTLEEYLKKIRGYAKSHYHLDTTSGPNYGEIIGEYSPETLRGVRIANDADPEKAEVFRKFAEEYKLPVYSWTSKGMTRQAQDELIKDILSGRQGLGEWEDLGNLIVPRQR